MRVLIKPLVLFQMTPSGVFAVPQEVAVFIGHPSLDADLVALEVADLLSAFAVFGCQIADLCWLWLALGKFNNYIQLLVQTC